MAGPKIKEFNMNSFYCYTFRNSPRKIEILREKNSS